MGYLLLGREYRSLPTGYSRSTPDTPASQDIARPGDLILVRTRGIGYAFGRRLTRNNYDHIAVVLPGNMTLNIVLPRPVILPISVLSKPQNAPLILRPNWKSIEKRDEFVEEINHFRNKKYDTRKTLLGIFSTCLSTWLGIRIPIKKPNDHGEKWICTEAILYCLLKTLPEFEMIKTMRLDYNILGFASTNDFLRISRKLPNLLSIPEVR